MHDLDEEILAMLEEEGAKPAFEKPELTLDKVQKKILQAIERLDSQSAIDSTMAVAEGVAATYDMISEVRKEVAHLGLVVGKILARERAAYKFNIKKDKDGLTKEITATPIDANK
jgi:hypothetical protein